MTESQHQSAGLEDSWVNAKTQLPVDSDFEGTPDVPGYDLREVIGRGGQAVVFLAEQELTSKLVAVKVLRSGPVMSSSDLARFKRESSILSSLDHPAIVGVIETGRTPQGQFYLVMDYVFGQQLDQYLGTSMRDPVGSQDVRYKVELMARVCDAVEVAHARGIMHRDLKPSNIIIDNDGNPHLLDFGLARYTKQGDPSGEEEMTMTGQFVGTMPWASPEQVRGNASIIDIRSDVYTLGLVLYRMLTGQYPYGVKGDVPDVLRNITEAPPMPMNDAYALSKPESQRSWLTSWLPHRPEIDPVLEAIVFKALTKDAEYRYLSAGDLARDLHSYLEGTPTVAAGFAERLGLIRVLKVAVVTAAVAGLFALISLAIASGWFDERVRPPKPANIQSISGTSDRVNVLHLVNLKRHRLSGGWHREGGGIRGEAEPRGRSELVLPVVLQNRYQVEVTFVRFEGEGGVSVFLPLGNGRSVTLTIGAADGKHAGLSRVDNRNAEDRNNPTSMPIEITTRVPHTVRIAVTPKQGDDVHIAGTLDDETIVNWTGPVTQLRTEYIRYKARDSWRDTLGLIVMPNTSVHFSKVHVEQY